MSPLTDETLMERFTVSGDRNSFGALIRRYVPVATGVAARLLNSRDEAQDAVQDAFVNIIRAQSDYRPSSPFGPWFYRILRNVCLDRLRKRKSLSEALGRLAAELVTEDRTPPDENGQPILDLVRRLPETDRRVLLLRVVDGLQLAEIAEVCGCSEEAAKKRAQRGLKRLKQLMAHTNTGNDRINAVPLMSAMG